MRLRRRIQQTVKGRPDVRSLGLPLQIMRLGREFGVGELLLSQRRPVRIPDHGGDFLEAVAGGAPRPPLG